MKQTIAIAALLGVISAINRVPATNLAQLTDHSDEFFTAGQSGHLGLDNNTYERVLPPQFADGQDKFMSSMLDNYADEGKNADGTPNHKFSMTEAATKQAATEVLESHKGLKAKDLEGYLSTYFGRTWAHFDVNKAGRIDAADMPAFMRFLASDQQLNLE